MGRRFRPATAIFLADDALAPTRPNKQTQSERDVVRGLSAGEQANRGSESVKPSSVIVKYSKSSHGTPGAACWRSS
jgi:hypothetical protein